MGPYDTDGAAVIVLAAIGIGIGVLLAAGGYVLTSLFMMKVFDKAGVQGRWRAWVPIYNTMVFAKLGDLSPWWLLVAWGAGVILAPVGVGGLFFLAASVYTVLAAYRVGLKLQKEPVWVVLYIFLSVVWLGILGFDRSRWSLAVPPAPWANSFLRDTTQWAGIPAQVAAPQYAAAGYAAYPPPPPAAAGYQPTAGSQPPAAPAGSQPPAAPAGYQPPAATQPPPYEPPQPPTAPPDTEPPAAPEPPRQP